MRRSKQWVRTPGGRLVRPSAEEPALEALTNPFILREVFRRGTANIYYDII